MALSQKQLDTITIVASVCTLAQYFHQIGGNNGRAIIWCVLLILDSALFYIRWMRVLADTNLIHDNNGEQP